MIKMIVAVLFLVFSVCIGFGQIIPKEYNDLIKKAETYTLSKDFKNAAIAYSSAFKAFGWKGFPDDRYKAASAWALTNVPDSAFVQLQQITGYYHIVQHLATDPVFKSLRKDKRWQAILDAIEQKKQFAE